MTTTDIAASFYLSESERILSSQTELTPEKAAEFLCVSESFLLELLDSGEIELRSEGKQRWVVLRSMVKYDQKMTRRRLNALEEMASESQELDLY
ncbi:MAG: hypothetical protein LBU65_04855 [Planctomycetaceae bacterium]|jgi:hypothetical protein|nr:hypothetical protein [Planctomycetaceae bacterium]